MRALLGRLHRQAKALFVGDSLHGLDRGERVNLGPSAQDEHESHLGADALPHVDADLCEHLAERALADIARARANAAHGQTRRTDHGDTGAHPVTSKE